MFHIKLLCFRIVLSHRRSVRELSPRAETQVLTRPRVSRRYTVILFSPSKPNGALWLVVPCRSLDPARYPNWAEWRVDDDASLGWQRPAILQYIVGGIWPEDTTISLFTAC